MMIDHGQSRAEVVHEAMTWVGTPYHHHARIKGVGVDCAQFLVGVYSAVGVAPPLDLGNYPAEWNLHHSEERFADWIEAAGAVEIAEPQPGDMALFKYGRCYAHGAIVLEPGRAIHSYLRLGVWVHRLCEAPLHGRPVRYFTPWK